MSLFLINELQRLLPVNLMALAVQLGHYGFDSCFVGKGNRVQYFQVCLFCMQFLQISEMGPRSHDNSICWQ